MRTNAAGPDVRGVAHDMRSPLSVIKAYLASIDIAGADDEGMEIHTAAVRSVNKLLALVEALRRPSGEFSPKRAAHDIVKIVLSSIEEASPKAQDAGVMLCYVGPQKLMAWVDDMLIGRVLTNLIVNAIQACAVSAEVRVEALMRAGFIILSVVDGGVGMDAAVRRRIFDRGFTHGKADGTGLGLDLSSRIVRAHGGSIDVHSEKGAGTAFSIALPAAIGEYDCISSECPQSSVSFRRAGSFAGRSRACEIGVALRDETLD